MRQRLLSRCAESVYWMSRYIERAENVARFIDVNVQLMLDAPPGASQQWQPVIDASGDSETFAEKYDEATRESVVHFLTFDTENPNSIASCIRSARENARTVRDTISSEMWEQANQLYWLIVNAPEIGDGNGSLSLYRDVRMGCHLFEGIADSTMSHNEAWQFTKLGQALERADKTSRILDVKYFLLLPSVTDVGSPIDDVQWTAVLKSISGFEMYRKRHGRINPTQVVEFALLDREFPRTIRFCVDEAAHALYAITGTKENTFSNAAEQQLAQLRAELDYASVRDILSRGLHDYLDGLQARLNRIDDDVFSLFFAMRPLRMNMRQSQSQPERLAAAG